MSKQMTVLFIAVTMMWVGCESGGTRIASLEPNFGNVAGNDQVTILGNGFKAPMTVQFGKKESTSVVVDSPTRIVVKTPSGIEGNVDVVITRDDGKTFVLPAGFTYRRDAPSSR